MLCKSCLESILCQSDVSFDMAIFLKDIRSVHKLTHKAVVVQRAISYDFTFALLLWIYVVSIVHNYISRVSPGRIVRPDSRCAIGIICIHAGYVTGYIAGYIVSVVTSAGFRYTVGSRCVICIVVYVGM